MQKKFKKTLFIGFSFTLALGASFIMGLLSFGGIFSLWPITPIAVCALILSVTYEGEIYFRNIKAALDKLLHPSYSKLDLARTYLYLYFPTSLSRPLWPKFFRQYEYLLQSLHRLNSLSLNQKRRIKKRIIERKLKAMEKDFADLLAVTSYTNLSLSTDKQALLAYLMNYPLTVHNRIVYESLPHKYQDTLKRRQFILLAIQFFSLLMVIFMGIGTACLFSTNFVQNPFFSFASFAHFSVFVLPLALIAGFAYGLLIYNTFTNMITHDSLLLLYAKFSHEIKDHGFSFRTVILIFLALCLFVLSVVLTCFTAGAWWNIVNKARPLFFWMTKIPKWVLNGCLPVLTSFASFIFNIENTSESLNTFHMLSQHKKHGFQYFITLFGRELKALWSRENIWQLLNPFRLILAFSMTPLRILFFLGHTISIGIVSPRAQRTLKIWPTLLRIVIHGFVDVHYFLNEAPYFKPDTGTLLTERLIDQQGKKNRVDLPTKLLIYTFFPLYLFASVWDSMFSQLNVPQRRLSFKRAFQKQWVL